MAAPPGRPRPGLRAAQGASLAVRAALKSCALLRRVAAGRAGLRSRRGGLAAAAGAAAGGCAGSCAAAPGASRRAATRGPGAWPAAAGGAQVGRQACVCTHRMACLSRSCTLDDGGHPMPFDCSSPTRRPLPRPLQRLERGPGRLRAAGARQLARPEAGAGLAHAVLLGHCNLHCKQGRPEVGISGMPCALGGLMCKIWRSRSSFIVK